MSDQPLTTNGRFFELDGHTHFLKAVTYGPFPPDSSPDPDAELSRISAAGFNALRLYEEPTWSFLDLALKNQLRVIYTPPWSSHLDFINRPALFSEAKATLVQSLRKVAHHPALAAILVANELPPDLVRFLGPNLIREHLEELIDLGKAHAPHLLFAYANFPTTEYLEPSNADFTAFNLYLEEKESFRKYLQRLHNVAGDRPLLLTECGLDTQRNSEEEQADLLTSQIHAAHELGCAGITLYAWSDLWWNNQAEMTDWSFGLTRRDGSAKPALENITATFQKAAFHLPPPLKNPPRISVIICAYNGATRLRSTLTHATQINYPNYEVLLIDDGSTDGTKELAAQFPSVRYFYQSNQGLSAARNQGAKLATGTLLSYTDDDCSPHPDWLSWIALTFENDPHENIGAAGGPNLAPPPCNDSQLVTSTAPGAPTHVLLDDTTAEHLPGCNLTVRKSALQKVGGFNPLFRVAGDDVDLCWRLHDADYKLAYSPPAFVWHYRRESLSRYFKQQIGYGKAEALLYKVHPTRFGQHGIKWQGSVYTGAVLRIQPHFSIYHGPMGNAPFQPLKPTTTQLPTRLLPTKNKTTLNCLRLRLCTTLQPLLRSLSRYLHDGPPPQIIFSKPSSLQLPKAVEIQSYWTKQNRQDLLDLLQNNGWLASPDDRWDLQKGPQCLLLATEHHPATNRHLIKLQNPTRDTWKKINQLL